MIVSVPTLLRAVFLCMLMLGVLVRPVFALACEIDDSQRAYATEHQEFSDARDASAEDGPQEDCCAVPGCGDCCSHATAAVIQLTAMAAMPSAAHVAESCSSDFQPPPPGVDLRPPITG